MWLKKAYTEIRSVKSLLRRATGTAMPKPPLAQVLAPLPEPFRSVLHSMYVGEPQVGTNGARYPIDAITRIRPQQGMWLYSLCRDRRPVATLEIGLAYGFSTVFFLAGLHANERGIHTAIDPFQEHYSGIGRQRAAILGVGESFAFCADTSVQALAGFARTGARFDVIFVDGNHRFDDVVVDFALAAPICSANGCIVFDDMWMPSIQKAMAFIRTNRGDFVEIATPIESIAVFQKVDDDRRPWDHFEPFG